MWELVLEFWGDFPTEINLFEYWNNYKKETCVEAGVSFICNKEARFGYANRDFFLKNGWEVISDKTFYEKQGITPEQRNEINSYFESLKK